MKSIVTAAEFRCLGPSIDVPTILNLQKTIAGKGSLIEGKLKHFALLSGHLRLKILLLLDLKSPLCVCDMADILATSASGVSHQLALLKKAGFVTPKRQAKTVFYRLSRSGRAAAELM